MKNSKLESQAGFLTGDSMSTHKTVLKLVKQVFRFSVVGAFSAVLDMGIMIVLVEWTQTYYLAASSVSAFCAGLANYFLSRRWVFTGGRHRQTVEFSGFWISGTIGLGFQQLLMLTMVSGIHLDYRLSKIISMAVLFMWNFFTRKYFVFAE